MTTNKEIADRLFDSEGKDVTHRLSHLEGRTREIEQAVAANSHAIESINLTLAKLLVENEHIKSTLVRFEFKLDTLIRKLDAMALIAASGND